MITSCEKIAVIYLRVSTEEQGESGLGLEAQEAACRAWCTSHGYKVVDLATDVCSGRHFPPGRPGFGKVLELMKDRPHLVVVAHSVSRLSRRQSHIWAMLDETGHWKLRFASASEPFDTSTSLGRAMLGMLAVWAQLEADMISERTRAALRAAKARGTKLGARSLEDMNPVLVNRIRRMHLEQGKSAATIAFELNLAGIPTVRGGKWHATTVARAFKEKGLDGQAAEGGVDLEAAAALQAAGAFDEVSSTGPQQGTEVEPAGQPSNVESGPAKDRGSPA